MVENVIIVGSGPAGLTAALYTAREGLNPLVISGMAFGGQLQLTTVVENFPAFPDGIPGPDLVMRIRNQAQKFGARFIDEDLTGIETDGDPFKVMVNEKEYESRSIIIATGASAKWLGLDSEQRLIGRGVSSCATCDGPLYRNKKVAVVGGGDTAMEDSLFLSKFAREVIIIHRRDKFRASKILQSRVMSTSNIKIRWNSIVDKVIGSEFVKGIRIKNTVNGTLDEIQIDGLFVAIGHAPNTSFLKGKLKLDEKGYVITRDEVFTDIPGIFVAGDVADKRYRQAITAAASGAKAALEVRAFLMQ